MADEQDCPLKLDKFMPYTLAVASNFVSDQIAAIYRERFGLKIPEWRMMAVLGDSGGVTQRQLVSLTVMDKVTVNRATKALEERGLLQRAPNAADGRSHHLTLTAAGLSLYREIVPAALAAERRVMAALSAEELETLRVLLERLRAGAR